MPTTLASIKKDLEGRIGSPIMLVAQTGRKRQTERRGVLTETYPSVFVVDLDPEENSLNEYLTAIQMYLLGQLRSNFN